MRRLFWTAALLAVIATALVGAAAGRNGPSSPSARAAQLAAGLRCPVCQGLSVADSQSETARSIRSDIRRRLAAGESDGEIRRAYVQRYGAWILLEPQATGLSALVWALPAGVIVAAGGLLLLALRRASRRHTGVPTPEDLVLVDALRLDSGSR